MDQLELHVDRREILGKKVRFLRRQGITPVHVFGHGIESEALQCETAKLRPVLAEAGGTRLINLKVGRERIPRNVVVREIQREPRTGGLLHVDFYQVRMEEAVRVDVPIVFVGEAPALRLKENTLAHELTSLTVECLPAKIPANIEVDISSLEEADQAIRVGDIKLDEEVTVLNEPELMVARISARPVEVEEVEEVEEEVVAEEEALAAEAKAEAPEAEEAETKEN
jgi:large subunit ribosomal protein L25